MSTDLAKRALEEAQFKLFFRTLIYLSYWRFKILVGWIKVDLKPPVRIGSVSSGVQNQARARIQPKFDKNTTENASNILIGV